MQAAVVGGAGFIGAHLVQQLCSAGVDTLVIDWEKFKPRPEQRFGVSEKHSYRRKYLLTNAEIICCDAAVKAELAEALRGRDIDCLFYLAALPVVHLANQKYVEAGDSMLRGLMNCLEIVRECGRVRRFIYVSSSMVYGDFTQDPLPESAAAAPTNLYGGFKLAGETLTRAYLGNTDIESVIIRPTGVYGPTALNNTVVQTFCEAAILGGALEARDARNTFIDFTWVEDLAAGLAQAGLVAGIGNEIFNLSFGEARSLEELVGLVVAAQPSTRVLFTAEHDRTRPRRGGALDITKAKDRLGYVPQINLEAGILRYMKFLHSSEVHPQVVKANA